MATIIDKTVPLTTDEKLPRVRIAQISVIATNILASENRRPFGFILVF